MAANFKVIMIETRHRVRLCSCLLCLGAQLCLLFANTWTVTRQAPLSMRILQARVLERAASPFSTGSSRPRDPTQVSCTTDGFFTS